MVASVIALWSLHYSNIINTAKEIQHKVLNHNAKQAEETQSKLLMQSEHVI
jgi:hypothetical protein